MAVVGAGYIAVELAGVLNGLGSDVSLFTRRECALRNFDVRARSLLLPPRAHTRAQRRVHARVDRARGHPQADIKGQLREEMDAAGIHHHPHSNLAAIDKAADGTLTVKTKEGASLDGFDVVMFAIGRKPGAGERVPEQRGRGQCQAPVRRFLSPPHCSHAALPALRPQPPRA